MTRRDGDEVSRTGIPRLLLVTCCVGVLCSQSACGADDEDDDNGGGGQSEPGVCQAVAENAKEPKSAKLYFEWQSTDGDTGIHGLMTGSSDWAELCVRAPDGERFLHVSPQGSLKEFGMADIFFESREPPADTVSQAEVLGRFPPGDWEVFGRTIDGEAYRGVALVTHDIPLPPQITAPEEDSTVDPAQLVVAWDPVTKTVAGDSVRISAYEVIVTNETKDSESPDPNGMSLPVISAHLIPSVTSLTIPVEFLEPDTEYELEVIAIEESGNQTISVSFFSTEAS